MSDLDDLEAFAAASFYGAAGGILTRRGSHNPARETCGAGHLWTEETTKRYKYRGRWRRICLSCEKDRAAIRKAARTQHRAEANS